MRDDTKGGESHFWQQDGDELKTQSGDCLFVVQARPAGGLELYK
ncbi:MAG: hypothetical protein NXH89_21860 [Cyclobacteriaceae bacterium]|nr:hypothetical protein [Cyclobacteriaceae bacterium]